MQLESIELILIPFDARFAPNPTKDNEFLADKDLKTHLSDNCIDEFFGWCLQVAVEYLEENGFTEIPERVSVATSDYRKDCDIMKQFLAEAYNIEDKAKTCPIKILKKRFSDWMFENKLEYMLVI